MHIHQRSKTILLRVTVIQMILLTQNSLSGMGIQTVDLLYLSSTGLQGVPVGYNKQRHSVLIKTVPHSTLSYASFLKLYNRCWKRQTNVITKTEDG